VSLGGTKANDTITGTRGIDVISGGPGDDVLVGLGAGDFICGGPGDDDIDGGDGSDILRAGAGNDTVLGGDGIDYIKGQGGDDSADGGPSVDICLVEHRTNCEVDLAATLYPPRNVTGGDETVASIRAGIWAPFSMALTESTYIELTLPAEAVFAPDASSPSCRARGPSTVTCAVDSTPHPPGGFSFDVGVRFPASPPSVTQVAFVSRVTDLYTDDPVPENNTATEKATLSPGPSCP
jgi:hypothetical protein